MFFCFASFRDLFLLLFDDRFGIDLLAMLLFFVASCGFHLALWGRSLAPFGLHMGALGPPLGTVVGAPGDKGSGLALTLVA